MGAISEPAAVEPPVAAALPPAPPEPVAQATAQLDGAAATAAFDGEEGIIVAKPPAQAAAPAPHPFTILEFERWMPFFGWRHPVAARDPHAFEDGSGRAAATAPTTSSGWALDVDGASTDADGWVYGTTFARLGDYRAGGRRGKRGSDICRRRSWRYGLDGPPPAAPAPGATGESDDESGAFLFWQMVRSTLGRRPLAEIPMDPGSLYRVRKQHAAAYRKWCGGRSPAAPSEASLTDLAHAMIYIRAGYGFAMVQGHMDSVRRGAAMFTVSKMHFDVTEDVDDDENTASLLRLADLGEDDLCGRVWSNATYKPSFFVGLDHGRRWVVLAVRGTLATRDLLTDATASQVSFCGGHAHLGFCKCAAFVEDEAAPMLRDAHARVPDYELILCGHSMGGSVAAILALARARGGSPWPAFGGGCRVLHMGAAACLSRALAEEAAAFCGGAVHGKDPVPRLSIAAIEALLDELVDNGIGRTLSNLVFGDAPRVEARPGEATFAHEPGADGGDAYAAVADERFWADARPPRSRSSALARALGEGASRVRVPLFPPGDLVQVDWDASLTRPGGRAWSLRSSKGPRTAVAFAAGPGDYDRLLLSYTLMGYHLPKGYCELLFELARAYGPDDGRGGDRAALRAKLAACHWTRPEDKGRLF